MVQTFGTAALILDLNCRFLADFFIFGRVLQPLNVIVGYLLDILLR
jgi:hypothetical protein